MAQIDTHIHDSMVADEEFFNDLSRTTCLRWKEVEWSTKDARNIDDCIHTIQFGIDLL